MILELCTNRTLRHFHKNHGVVPIGVCRYFVNQILEGAQYIHVESQIELFIDLALL